MVKFLHLRKSDIKVIFNGEPTAVGINSAKR